MARDTLRPGTSPAEAREREAIEFEIREDWQWSRLNRPGTHSPQAEALLLEAFRDGWLARHRRGRRSGP